MKEITITSGRMNAGIDPVLHAWGWEIPLYLFIGGLAAGILFFSAYFFLKGKGDKFRVSIQIGPMFVPPLLAIGLLALFLDLSHKLYFWRLYTTIRLDSPMSWGAWTLMLIFPLSVAWALSFVSEAFPQHECKFPAMGRFIAWLQDWRTFIAWALIILSIILGMYTGILLSAFNARPFWNTSILGPLFLVSGFSTGTAFLMLLSKDKEERRHLSQIDMILIGIELFLIIHLFMGFLASTQVHIDAAHLFLGGPYTAIFWTFVVALGLVFPLSTEFMELRGYHIPPSIPAAFVLIGGLILRFIVVDAGQTSRWLYKFME